jgi:hypothetical protein
MTYNEVIELIKNTADFVNPNGLFLHGRNFDLTLEFNQVFPQVHLYPFTQTIDRDNTHIVQTTMLVGFWAQDGHENSLSQRQSIINDMDLLSIAFETKLREAPKIQILSIRREPQYLMYMGVLSGVALNIIINSGRGCPPLEN